MLFIGRPLTLIIIAISTYVLLSWRFVAPSEYSKSRSQYGSDANGLGSDESQRLQYQPGRADKQDKPQAPIEVEPTSLPAKKNTGPQTGSPAVSSTYTATSDLPMPTLDSMGTEEYMKNMINWNRPSHVDGHWPNYEDYETTEYDPNRWEGFDLDRNFYASGVQKFTPAQINAAQSYLPYPQYSAAESRKKWHGQFQACDGPLGERLDNETAPSVRAYPVIPANFPRPFTGSAEAIGLNSNVCFDRVQRYGAYGLDPAKTQSINMFDWNGVKWGELQAKCFERNKERFDPKSRREWKTAPDFKVEGQGWTFDGVHQGVSRNNVQEPLVPGQKQYRKRTAILIRTWEGYKYTANDILAVRAMVSELSLRTGGEYQVFLFVNIKNYDEPIFTDRHAYYRMLIKNVPQELRDIAVLWSERVCKQMYPNITDWQVYWHQFMSVQWFSQQHPEYEYIWNWEMDVRYIGNHFDFLDTIAEFAQAQPRKYLWERNARYYIPSFHGRDYGAFVKDTHAAIANASKLGESPQPVWGPLPYKADEQSPIGPEPPHSIDEDDFSWGVGEEADLITLLPIWDPSNTSWAMRHKIWNFNQGVHPVFNDEHPTDDEFADPDAASIPRRAFINTVLRLSKTLLQAMHDENVAGRTMQAEMWPTTVALHHGLKAVYAPHPIYSAVTWPARYADAVFNAVDPAAAPSAAARWSQGANSIYNQDREVNFRPFSWYYHARFPRVLYRRWMGWSSEDGLGDLGGPAWEHDQDGAMCLPPMLLHPVKRGDLEDDEVELGME